MWAWGSSRGSEALGGQPVVSASGTFPPAPRSNGPGTIPSDQYRGAVLLVSGSDDGLWPSERYENAIMDELRADPAAHVHLNYPNAGHANLGPPYTPVELNTSDHGAHLNLGGTVAGSENAREHDWPAMLRFITSH